MINLELWNKIFFASCGGIKAFEAPKAPAQISGKIFVQKSIENIRNFNQKSKVLVILLSDNSFGRKFIYYL